ncbi:MAG: sulfurtransferase-like selenium metabolism protein YedF [Syntrophomonadaceae bacterium]
MGKVIDARGLSCPQPVIMTKKAMDEPGGNNFTTIVNQIVALENIGKLAKSQGYDVEVEQNNEDYYIHLTKMAGNDDDIDHEEGKAVIMVRSNLFGQGESELGQLLMKNFLYSLNEIGTSISYIIFMNSGIFLALEGSPVLDNLRVLEQKGTEILSCGTCLDYYQAKNKLAIGSITNMYTALEILTTAGRSIVL